MGGKHIVYTTLCLILFFVLGAGFGYALTRAVDRIRQLDELQFTCTTENGFTSGAVHRRDIVEAPGWWVITWHPGERPIISDQCQFTK